MTQLPVRRSYRLSTAEHRDVRALAEDHLPLVAALVRRFPPGLHEPEELYQQGCIGLMKALARYRPECGTAFSTYAVPLILGEMRLLSRQYAPIHIPRPEREQRQRIRRMTSQLTATLSREPTINELAAALRMDPTDLLFLLDDVTVSSTEASSDDGSPLIEALADEDDWLSRMELRDLIAQLPERDRQLLTLRHIEGLSQAATAHRLGMTQIQVSRREAVLRRQLHDAWYGT